MTDTRLKIIIRLGISLIVLAISTAMLFSGVGPPELATGLIGVVIGYWLR